MLHLVIRTLIIYIVLIASIRLTGKRQVGEMQLSELINAFLISEVAAAPITDPDLPLVYGILPVVFLVCLEIIISFVITKSLVFKRLFESPPTPIIANGKLNIHALEKQRLSADELISSLRLKDIADISDIKYCFLEHNGQISAFSEDDGLSLPVIIDGKANHNFLKLIGRDEGWMKKRLSENKLSIDDVFLMTTDGTNVAIVKKEQK